MHYKVQYGILACLLAGAAQGRAEDVVQTKTGITQRGRIVAYDSNELEIVTTVQGKSKSLTFRLDELGKVEIERGEDLSRAERYFDQGKYRLAAASFEIALGAESREWLRRRIFSSLLKCHLQSGNTMGVLECFAQADLGKLPEDSLPLRWLPAAVPPQVQEAAERLMASAVPVQALVGASFLFGSSGSDQARRTLDSLAGSEDAILAALARAQTWRWELETADLPTVASWQRSVWRLPVALRAGPQFVIGMALQKAGAYDDAALAFYWPGLVFRNDPELSAQAMLLAGESLEHAGKTADAKKIYDELTTNYSGSVQSAQATIHLRELRE